MRAPSSTADEIVIPACGCRTGPRAGSNAFRGAAKDAPIPRGTEAGAVNAGRIRLREDTVKLPRATEDPTGLDTRRAPAALFPSSGTAPVPSRRLGGRRAEHTPGPRRNGPTWRRPCPGCCGGGSRPIGAAFRSRPRCNPRARAHSPGEFRVIIERWPTAVGCGQGEALPGNGNTQPRRLPGYLSGGRLTPALPDLFRRILRSSSPKCGRRRWEVAERFRKIQD